MAGPWSGQKLSPYILRIYVYVYTYTFYVVVLATLALSRKVLALPGNRATLRFTCSRYQQMTAAELRQRLSDVVRAPTTWGRTGKTATEPQDEVLGAVLERPTA